MENRREGSLKICETLMRQISGADISHVCLYHAMRAEVDLSALAGWLWEENIAVYFPRIEDHVMHFYRVKSSKEFSEGFYGIMEPVGREELDTDALILVPGLAFDINGYRLGYGGGYYDHFLKEHPCYPTIGVCFEEQIASLSDMTEAWDRPVDLLITPMREIICKKNGGTYAEEQL